MAFEILKQAFKDKYIGVIIAAILIFLYIFWLATFYPTMKPMVSGYEQLLQNPSMKAFFGDEVVSMTSFVGFMSLEALSYMGLVISAFFIFMVASFVSGEIEQKSCELLLSLPVSRTSIILSRFVTLIPFAAVIMLAMLAAVYFGGAYIGEDTHIKWFAIAFLFMGVFVIAIGAMTLLISAILSDGRKAALISLGIMLAMFLVENIGSMVTSIDLIRKLSLFHYAKVVTIINTQTVDWANLGIMVAAIVVFVILAVVAFRRRDINVS
jgi:ABC-2 type transport system permease protein